MSEQLYKGFAPKEGEYVQFVGVHALSWQQEWGKPEMAFIENDYDEEAVEHTDTQLYTNLLTRLREAVEEIKFEIGDDVPLPADVELGLKRAYILLNKHIPELEDK